MNYRVFFRKIVNSNQILHRFHLTIWPIFPQNLHTNTELYLNSQHSIIIASAQIQYVVISAIVLDLTTFQKTGPITDVYFLYIVYFFHSLQRFGLVWFVCKISLAEEKRRITQFFSNHQRKDTKKV